MQRLSRVHLVLALASAVLASNAVRAGAPELESAGPIAFAPDGVLLVADTLGATIYAIETGDTKGAKLGKVRVERLGETVAALLGAKPDDIRITDLAVNPASGRPYISVHRDSKPVILRVEGPGKLGVFSLEKRAFTKVELPNAPGRTEKGRRGRPKRLESITDLAHIDERVLVAGLSNEEFASTLRTIPYPFAKGEKASKGAQVEVYHGAHGKLETHSPVRTFVPFNMDGSPQLLAAYTCTPLVRFPIADLKPGGLVRGTTIAELGNRNRPLDMITYKKNDTTWLLVANSSRGLMKVPTDKVMTAKHIDTRVPRSKTAGIGYENVPGGDNIDQLDRLDHEHAVVIRNVDGAQTLETMPLP